MARRARGRAAAGAAAFLAPLRRSQWVVYSKKPFGGPEAVLAYLSRYTHRVAISNRRLIAVNETGVTFKYKDYRIEGPERYKRMTLATGEFIRRFLNRAENIARARELLAMPAPHKQPATAAPSKPDQPSVLPRPCPCCGGRMIVIETFAPGCQPNHRPAHQPSRIDTS